MYYREWFMQTMNRLTGENGWTDARIKALEEAQLNQRQYDLCTDKKRNFVWGVSIYLMNLKA